MLELADKDFKKAVINIFEDVTENMDMMSEQMGNLSRDMGTRSLEGPNSRLETAEEKISQLEDRLAVVQLEEHRENSRALVTWESNACSMVMYGTRVSGGLVSVYR